MSSYPDWKDVRESLLFWRFMTSTVPMIEADMPSFMGQRYATSPDDLKGADVAIIGSPYVAGWEAYAGVSKSELASGPKRVRQQSIKYRGGYIQEFDLDVFEHLKVVDYGNGEIPADILAKPTADNIIKAMDIVSKKVSEALDAGALPVVVGQNSPCSSYAVARPLIERTKGNVGAIVADTHWDSEAFDEFTRDPRVPGQASWKTKMYEFHKNMLQKNLVEIGERGMWESKDRVREMLGKGTHWYPIWKIRRNGIEEVCKDLHYAYDGTDAVFVHFDMDVLGGAGPASGDLLGELAEPMGLSDYEVLRLANEIGRKGCAAFSIALGGITTSPVMCRVVVYTIMYLLAGIIAGRK